MVENFGSYLRHERELRGVPLEEISGATKIHIRFLQALEDNKFEELPGQVFIKGYIRSYADTIGSDAQEMLNIYEESVGNKPLENKAGSERPPNIPAGNFSGLAVTGILILALMLGAEFLLSDPKKPPETKAGPSASPPEKVPAKEPSPAVEKNTKEKEAPGETPPVLETLALKNSKSLAGKKETAQLLLEAQNQESAVPEEAESREGVEKRLKLTIKVINDSWFNMTIDDFREEDFILPAGNGKSFFANESFRLTIGNTQGTKITLNGKALEIPEGRENVVRNFIINSKSLE